MDIELLHAERLDAWGDRLKYPLEATQALQSIAALVRTDSELGSIFSEFYQRTVLQDEWYREWSDLPMDPRVPERLGERASLFYLLGYMAALPNTLAWYTQHEVSGEVFDDTMKDFLNYLGDFYDLHGYWGYAHFAWIWRHLTCELFRLGRLQYMLAPFHGGVTAFRRRHSPRQLEGSSPSEPADRLPAMKIALLADPNLPLRADGAAFYVGQFPDADEPLPPEAWKPVYEVSASGWGGHLVNPYGFARRERTFLPRSEWELILQPGDTVLELHIPRKDPLNTETCSVSFRQATDFFSRVFPDRSWQALYCHTWFFTPQLQDMLPPDSAIVKFQREFYLFPFPGSIGFLWSFVFGEKYTDPFTAPRDTLLRRVVLDRLDQNKEIFDLPGVMFHSPEEWGWQPYMSAWDKSG